MKIVVKSFSAAGKVRKNNEDNLFTNLEKKVFAVADGMGGGAEGEKASAMVCSALEASMAAEPFPKRVDAIGEAIEKVNCEIHDYAAGRGFKQMGSTIALLMLEGGESKRAAICHIGDSRVYRIRGKAAELLTRDHSVGEELAMALGESKVGDTFTNRSNPLAHVLTRAIGTENKVKCEWRKLDVEAGDIYLICSDGVHDVIETDELPAIFTAEDLEKTVQRLSEQVLQRGAPDNYSFVIVSIGKEES